MLLPPKKNRRQPTPSRAQRSSRREGLDVARNPVRMTERQTLGLKKWIGILFLAPVAFVTILTLVEMGWRLVTRHGINLNLGGVLTSPFTTFMTREQLVNGAECSSFFCRIKTRK